MDYRILEKCRPYEGFFKIDVVHAEHEAFDGGTITVERECLERGDAVIVLLYDPNRDEVLLLEQFRIGPTARDDNPWLIEVVAGMLHPDESPIDCARRECIEEAGYKPKSLKSLGCYYASPGGTSERVFLYMSEIDAGKPVGKGGGLDSEHEDIRVFWVKRKEALAMIHDGRINSSGPMLALLLAFETLESDQ